MSNKQTKLSHDQQQKLAEVEQFDREQAFEAGFAKAASDLGLNDQQFRGFYEAGCEKLSAGEQTLA